MHPQERLQPLIKTVLLVALGVFLYTRLANGTLTYYINERFVLFTVIGIIGLVVLGLSYRWQTPEQDDGDVHDAHDHDHAHSHALSWRGVGIVALPIVLGLAITPQPLGTAALANRDVTLSMNESALPLSLRNREKSATDKNIMDWWQEFRSSSQGGQELIGQEVRVSGFVFHDERFGAHYFLVTRFVVSCCVADASVLGLLVQLPPAMAEANELITDDTWVEVHGHFVAEPVEGWHMPLVQATQIQPIAVPDQPYLYP